MNQKKKAKEPEHLSWAEINSILAKITAQTNGVLRYLPPNHPESFCQSLIGAGIALERLTNEARQLIKNPPQQTTHEHK